MISVRTCSVCISPVLGLSRRVFSPIVATQQGYRRRGYNSSIVTPAGGKGFGALFFLVTIYSNQKGEIAPGRRLRNPQTFTHSLSPPLPFPEHISSRLPLLFLSLFFSERLHDFARSFFPFSPHSPSACHVTFHVRGGAVAECREFLVKTLFSRADRSCHPPEWGREAS